MRIRVNTIVSAIAALLTTYIIFYTFSFISYDQILIYNGFIAILSTVFIVISIWLFDQDPIKSIVLDILIACCTAYALGYGKITAILLIIAAIASYIERDKAKINIESNITNFSNEQQPNTQVNTSTQIKDKRLWIIPIAFIIIMGILFAVTDSAYDQQYKEQQYAQYYGVEVSNASLPYAGDSSYLFRSVVTPLKSYNYLRMQVILYDGYGNAIGENSCVWNMNHPLVNEQIRVTGYVDVLPGTTPVKAEVYFYESSESVNSTPVAYQSFSY